MLMQNSKVLKAILAIAGLMFVAVGIFSMFSPESFVARNGASLGNNLSLLNDYRGSGGLIFGAGLIILLGVIHSRMAFTSTVVATVLFLTFGIGRAISVFTDGMPAEGLMKAMVVEIIVGLLGAFALIKFRKS